MRPALAIALIFLSARILGAETVAGTITLSAHATDVTPAVGDTECGVASVQFMNGDTAIGLPITTPSAPDTYVLVLDTRTIPNGTYTITAKATDRAGIATTADNTCDGSKHNVGTSNALTLVVNNIPPVDNVGPIVTITVTITTTK